MHRYVGPRALIYPTRVWLTLLLLLFAAEYLVMLVLPMIVHTELPPWVGALVDSFTLTALLAPMIWWMLVHPLRQMIQIRNQFLGDLFATIEAERRQTAHEIHDGIGQEISLLLSSLRTAHDQITNPLDLARCKELQLLAQKALNEVRRVSLGLRPSLLDDLGLLAAIEKVIRDFREHSSIDITLHAEGLEGTRFPDAIESAAFRIFQEALSNIFRHSGAKHVEVLLRNNPRSLDMQIRDDGYGFVPNSKFANVGHIGLVGMKERASLLGGDFSLQTAPGAGCVVTVSLPVERNVPVRTGEDQHE